jgi:hypothetical protein
MKKLIIKKLLTLIPSLALALLISVTLVPTSLQAQESTAFKSAGKWLIGLKVEFRPRCRFSNINWR